MFGQPFECRIVEPNSDEEDQAMTKNSGGGTPNAGGVPNPTQEERARQFDITGNVEQKGEDPSPDNRARGERTSADAGSPVDLNNG